MAARANANANPKPGVVLIGGEVGWVHWSAARALSVDLVSWSSRSLIVALRLHEEKSLVYLIVH